MDPLKTAQLIASRSLTLTLDGQVLGLFHTETLDHIVLLTPAAEAMLRHARIADGYAEWREGFRAETGAPEAEIDAFFAAQLDIWAALPGLCDPVQKWDAAAPKGGACYHQTVQIGPSPVSVALYDADIAALWEPLIEGHGSVEGPAAAVSVMPDGDGFLIQTASGLCHRAQNLLAARGELVAAVIDASFPAYTDTPNIHGATLLHEETGKTLLITGDSGQGKTTLSLGLAEMGFTLAADDFSVFEPKDARFFPVQFNPSVKSGAWEVLAPFYPALAQQPIIPQGARQCKYLPRVPDLSLAGEGHQIDFILMPEWAAGAETQIIETSPMAAILSLLENSHLPFHQAHLQAMLDYFAARPVYTLRYSRFEGAKAAIEGLIR